MATTASSIPRCPFEDVSQAAPSTPLSDGCPFHKTKHVHPPVTVRQDVPINLEANTFTANEDSIALLRDIGGSDRIMQMTTRFYSHAFEDFTLDKFMFEKDGAANHGQRIGSYIAQKMGGEGDLWSKGLGRHGMRAPSHAKAWHNLKRKRRDRGIRFKQDDCRIWMRLMFWSAREVGLDKHKAFFRWYVGFIGHFITVYEASARHFAKESADWSAKPENIDKYIKDGKKMVDVIGVGR
jgi:truncated hemoglobin YjbI